MTGTIIRDKILREDLALYDGVTATATRLDSTGGSISGTPVNDFVDVLSVYGGSRNAATLLSAVRAIGTSDATLAFAPGAWTIDANVTIPNNLDLYIPSGAILTISNGITLTAAGCVTLQSPNSIAGTGTFTAAEINGSVHGITALAGLQKPGVAQEKYLAYYSTAGDGGQGWFRWSSSDLSTQVASDTRKGIYCAVSGEDGSTGAWVRQIDGNILNTAWWHVDGVDIGPAIQAAVTYAESLADGGWEVRLPPGDQPIKSTVSITKGGIAIVGAATTGAEGSAISVLTIAGNIADHIIDVDAGGTSIEGVRLENFAIQGDKTTAAGGTYAVTGYALYLRAFTRGTLRNVKLARINGGGIYTARAVKARIDDLDIQYCGDGTYDAVNFAYVSSAERMQATMVTGLRIEHCFSDPVADITISGCSIDGLNMEQSVGAGFPEQQLLIGSNSTNSTIRGRFSASTIGTGAKAKVEISGGRGIRLDGCQFAGAAGTYQVALDGDANRVVNSGFNTATTNKSVNIESTATRCCVEMCDFFGVGGIYDQGFASIIRNNTFDQVRAIDGYVIQSVGNRPTIDGNQLELSTGITSATAIFQVDGDHPSINNNKIRWTLITDPKGHAIAATGLRVQINNNEIWGAGKHGIFVDSGAAAGSVSTIVGNSIDYAGVEDTSSYDAIHLTASAQVSEPGTICGNQTHSHARDELRITDAAGVVAATAVYINLCVSGNGFFDNGVNNAVDGYASGGGNVVDANHP